MITLKIMDMVTKVKNTSIINRFRFTKDVLQSIPSISLTITRTTTKETLVNLTNIHKERSHIKMNHTLNRLVTRKERINLLANNSSNKIRQIRKPNKNPKTFYRYLNNLRADIAHEKDH